MHARAPIPTIGGIFRVYPVPNISITGEITGFTLGWVPQLDQGRHDGHYVDVDFYGTVNFTNNIGVQGGYRRFDVGYELKHDTGAFTVKGIYLGLVARVLSARAGATFARRRSASASVSSFLQKQKRSFVLPFSAFL